MMIMKSLYLLFISQFDAIVEMPFFRQNEIDLTELEFGNIEVNENKISISKDDMNMNMNTKSPGNMKIIKMISRKRWTSMWDGFRKPFAKVINLRIETNFGQTHGKPGGLVVFQNVRFGEMVLTI